MLLTISAARSRGEVDLFHGDTQQLAAGSVTTAACDPTPLCPLTWRGKEFHFRQILHTAYLSVATKEHVRAFHTDNILGKFLIDLRI
ncbi:MAG: hypothetical protein O8C68_02180 [Candidatus Methanoperedens sp.]|nr:hypothetical protein [Candidatus Methanoperedens sp.]